MKQKETEYVDIIRDEDSLTDKDLITEEGIIRHENGIIQDAKTGRFLPGNKGPGPSRKIRRLQELIKQSTNGGDALVKKLLEIALYDPEKEYSTWDSKKGEYVMKKKRNHFYNATTQMQAITLLANYYYGSPAQQVQVDKNVNINIEKKVADITQLINHNKERLKVVGE